ncbi:MAG: exonuclease SbcCD subunit D [Eubacteriales bacterium]|nr:exonuclease SbcCD subunit D [Eubacteriales bacterium]
MKLLHLSDLHLGKRLNEFSLIEDQDDMLQKIVEIVDREMPDAVLIAGDIYDKPVPSAEAVALFDSFLSRLSVREIPVFVISGNHDSAERIAFGASIMGRGGVYVSPVYRGHVEPIMLTDAAGVTARFYLLPFLKPATVRPYFPDREINTYTDAVRAVVDEMVGNGAESVDNAGQSRGDCGQAEESAHPENDRHIADSAGQSGERCRQADDAVWNILLAHQFVTGAARSDSEEVAVGGVDNVDASVFAPFDYVALGHLHGAQELRVGREANSGSKGAQDQPAGSETKRELCFGSEEERNTVVAGDVCGTLLRYCGAPLKYSFGEARQEKSVTVIELGEKRAANSKEDQTRRMLQKEVAPTQTEPETESVGAGLRIRTIPLVPLRDLLEIRGTYLEVTAREYYSRFDRNAYLHVTLTDEEDVPDAARKLALIYPNLMKLDYDNARTRSRQEIGGAERPEAQDPLSLFAEFYEKQNNQPLQPEQEEYLRELIGTVWRKE